MYVCDHYECRCNEGAICYRRPEPVFFHRQTLIEGKMVTINRCLSWDVGRRPGNRMRLNRLQVVGIKGRGDR